MRKETKNYLQKKIKKSKKSIDKYLLKWYNKYVR